MTSPTTLTTGSPEETQALGRKLGGVLQVGDLVLLSGPLGAGKTTLTQGIAWGAGVTGYAHSPTFVIVNEYQGRIAVYHLDLYRIEGTLEATDLAIDEMLEQGACVVEWAERAPDAFPTDHLAISLDAGPDEDARVITLTPRGARYDAVLASLAADATAKSRP